MKTLHNIYKGLQNAYNAGWRAGFSRSSAHSGREQPINPFSGKYFLHAWIWENGRMNGLGDSLRHWLRANRTRLESRQNERKFLNDVIFTSFE